MKIPSRGDHRGVIRAQRERRDVHRKFTLACESYPQCLVGRHPSRDEDGLHIKLACGFHRLGE